MTERWPRSRYGAFIATPRIVSTGLWGVLLGAILLGCGPTTSQDSPATESPSNITLPLAARLKTVPGCETDLKAVVIIDGNESNSTDLSVNCAAGTVSGTIPNLTPGSHTFELRFMLFLVEFKGEDRTILIASALTTGDITSGQSTAIGFAPGSLVFTDEDGDGWTNLAEFIANTEYRLASESPESPARRKSANYAVADSVGLGPAVGAATGGPYTDTLGRGIKR